MTPALTRNKPLTTSTDTGNVSVTHMLSSLAYIHHVGRQRP